MGYLYKFMGSCTNLNTNIIVNIESFHPTNAEASVKASPLVSLVFVKSKGRTFCNFFNIEL